MAYKKYTVKQGDCISSIAFEHGFFPDTIWNDPENSKLKQDRKDANVLFSGDEVFIRDKQKKKESCVSEAKHRFRRKGVPERLIIQFKTDGKPRANQSYALEIDGARYDGQTDASGTMQVWIPPNAKRGKITFRDTGDEYELILGDLDPITSTTGVQGRLNNLGFFSGEVNGEPSRELNAAIRAFQRSHNLPATGQLDDSTRSRIQQVYGA